MPALRPVVSSPLPSEPDLRVPPHPALREHWSGRPLVQLPLSVKYPLPSSGSSAPVFTGDLLPSNRAAGSLDPFALYVACRNMLRTAPSAKAHLAACVLTAARRERGVPDR